MNITIIYDKACPVFYVVGCNSFSQAVTKNKRINFRKNSNTEIQELPKLVGTCVRLTITQ